jgi:hypothetical protein
VAAHLPDAQQGTTGGTKRRGSLAGSASNTNLPNFAGSAGLAHLEAVNPGSNFYTLHRGFDTVEWNLALDNARLEPLLYVFPGMVGAGEQQDGHYSYVVSRVGGFSYRYKVAFSCGIDVYLPDHGFTRYGLRVVAHAACCLIADDVGADVLRVLSYVTGADELELDAALSLSRVDVCLDLLMPDADYQKFCGKVATRAHTVVTRARHVSSFKDGDRYTGVSVGKQEVKLRSYDKQAEALQGGDWKLWAAVYGRGAGFEVPEGYVVVRFEYQLRREFLKQCCVHGVEQHDTCGGLRSLGEFRAASADLLTYLTADWFRLAGAARGKAHTRVVLPFWHDVAFAFVASAWSTVSGALRRQLRRYVSTNLERLADMAAGCLASMAAVLGHYDGLDGGLSSSVVLGFLGRHIERSREKWQKGRDRRYRQLPYGLRMVPV